MNDGVAQMSRSVARKIKDRLGLDSIPSAVQGRFGSAKGMWIIAVTDDGDEDWIETYPSQRKWESDWVDEEHRTLEIRNHARDLKSASFNLQLLPVLEDRAPHKSSMRDMVGKLLEDNLQKDLDSQKKALESPLQFRQWTSENSSHKFNRVQHGFIPFQGGLPEDDEETMNFMLDSGFDPKKNKFLQDIAYTMQLNKCNKLKEKLHIKVGCSAYIYMVVDFLGVLEEDEVHIGFSSKFEADDWAETMVQGVDVLVARSPAHFVSDVQKVKAVFKPELAALKDVVVFSRKGLGPLADKLSGGDYDGGKLFALSCLFLPLAVPDLVSHGSTAVQLKQSLTEK